MAARRPAGDHHPAADRLRKHSAQSSRRAARLHAPDAAAAIFAKTQPAYAVGRRHCADRRCALIEVVGFLFCVPSPPLYNRRMSDGPDKSSYAWHFLTRFTPRYLRRPSEIALFREFVLESADAHNGFANNLRQAALYAVCQDDADLIRQALQCLAQVGLPEDIPALLQLSDHADSHVAADSKTCIFEIGRRPDSPDNPRKDAP
jgi:hypothetical protein